MQVWVLKALTQGLYGDADVVGLYQDFSTLRNAVAEFAKDMGYKLTAVNKTVRSGQVWMHGDDEVAWAWLEEVQ